MGQVVLGNAHAMVHNPVDVNGAAHGAGNVDANAVARDVPVAVAEAPRWQQVDQRLATMLKNSVQKEGVLLLSKQSIAEFVTPPKKRKGRVALAAIEKCAEAVKTKMAQLDALGINAFRHHPLPDAIFEAIKATTDSLYELNKAIITFENKTGVTAGTATLRQVTQQRIGELLNFVATAQTLSMTAECRAENNLNHDLLPIENKSVTGALTSLSTSMHQTQKPLEALRHSAEQVFAKLDALAGQRDALPRAELMRKYIPLSGTMKGLLTQIGHLQNRTVEAGDAPQVKADSSQLDSLKRTLESRQAQLYQLVNPNFDEPVANYIANAFKGIDDAGMAILHQSDIRYDGALNLVQAGRAYNKVMADIRNSISAHVAAGTLEANIDAITQRIRDLNKHPLITGLSFDNVICEQTSLLFTLRAEQLKAELHEVLFLAEHPQRAVAFPVSAEELRNAAENDVNVSALINASVYGIRPEFINTVASDRTFADEVLLGKGAANVVYKCHFQETNGAESEFVFKPELGARRGLDRILVGSLGYDSSVRTMQLNIASSMVADAIGCGDVIARSSIGQHHGEMGLFMELAPGKTAKDIVKPAGGRKLKPWCTLPDGRKANFVETLDYFRANGLEKTFVASLRKELANLEWADALSGQTDRHHSNYLVDVHPATGIVRVTGIDNDASFNTSIVGPGLIDMSKLKRTPADMVPQIARRIPQGDVPNPNGTILNINALRDGSPYAAALQVYTGLNQAILPSFIDRATHQRLMALDVEGYKDSLRSLMSADAVDAAGARLLVAQSHARTLEAQGRVIDDWSDARIGVAQFEEYVSQKSAYQKGFLARDFLGAIEDYNAARGTALFH